MKIAEMMSPKCPKCGTTMCEQFDERPGKGCVYMVPNGKYVCYACDKNRPDLAPKTEVQK